MTNHILSPDLIKKRDEQEIVIWGMKDDRGYISKFRLLLERLSELRLKLNHESYCHDKCVSYRTKAENERDMLKKALGLALYYVEGDATWEALKQEIKRRFGIDCDVIDREAT